MPLTVRYGPLLQGLLDAFGLESGTKAGEAFQARVKNLKRIDFPPAVQRAGSGRIDYRLGDVIALIIALRLVAAYVPPATAARLALAGSAQSRLSATDGLSIGVVADSHAKAARSVLLFSPNALDELGNREARAGRYEPPVHEADLMFLSLGSGGFGSGQDEDRPIRAEIATKRSIDGVSLDGLTTGMMLAQVLRRGGIDGRSAIAELSTAAESGEPPYDHAHSEEAFRWHAGRLLCILQERAGDAFSLTNAAVDLRLILEPTKQQETFANRPIWTASGDYSPSLVDAILVAVRLSGMPIDGIGDGRPASLSSIVLDRLDGAEPGTALLAVISDALTNSS